MESKKAYIHSFQNEYVYFQISTETNGKISSIKSKFKIDSIKFRNEKAPKSLLTLNAPAFCKMNGNNIIEAYLDPDIQLFVVFGRVLSVNPEEQSMAISDDFDIHEISWNIFVSSNGQKLPHEAIANSVGSPVITYYNSDSIIECKVAEESKVISLTLDAFIISKDEKKEQREYFCFKDSRLVLHKINANKVFYRNSSESFDADLVKQKLGTEVKVLVRNREFRAEVGVESPSISIQSKKYSKDDIQPSVKSNEHHNFTVNSRNHQKINPSNQHSNKSYNIPILNQPFQIPLSLNQPKVYGKRLLDNNTGYYYTQNENTKKNFVVLLGLFEIVFRFPDHIVRNVLYQQLFQESQKLGNSGLRAIIDEVFLIYRNPQEKSRIEEIYKKLFENKSTFEALIKNFINDPPNYDELAELFEISFWVNTSGNQWKSYYPFTLSHGSTFPIVLIQDSQVFHLLYTSDMMLYDGYDLKTLGYTNPQTNSANLKVAYQAQSPNTIEIFQNILELESFASELARDREEKFYELTKKLNYSLKAFASLAKPEEFSALTETFKKMNQVKVKELSCQCGNEVNSKYSCDNNHVLCKFCALVSTRIGKCLYCEVNVKLDISNEVYECGKCKGSYSEKYYVGFPCGCVYCSGCVYEYIYPKYCHIHSKPIPENIYNSLYQYLNKIWNPNQY